jgi:hypothetical protein
MKLLVTHVVGSVCGGHLRDVVEKSADLLVVEAAQELKFELLTS